MEYIDLIGKSGLMPAITIDNVNDAVNVAQAFLNGGQKIGEVTLRTPEAEDVIEVISKETDFIVGAGTVLTQGQAQRAIKAGAKFLVSPGFSPNIVKYAQDNGVEIIPGVATPTEIVLAMSYGIRIMKLFPVDLLGGIKYLKALEGPYFMTKFIPMGGINNDNLKDYISCENVFALGGPWMCKPDLIEKRNFAQIEANVKEAIKQIKMFR